MARRAGRTPEQMQENTLGPALEVLDKLFSLLGMETCNTPPVSFLRQPHGALGEPPKALGQLFCASCFVSHGWTGEKGRTYISKAQVRRCLSSTLLLVVCPVKVLARVTCRGTKQRESSATTPHHRERTKWAPSR